jgi:hypothetical protein
MTIDVGRRSEVSDTWFAQLVDEGWTAAGGGIYYPPDPPRDVPEPALAAGAPAAAAEPPGDYRLPHRRRELMRLRERLVERLGRFPNPVTERQLRELEQELAVLVGRLGPFGPARPT